MNAPAQILAAPSLKEIAFDLSAVKTRLAVLKGRSCLGDLTNAQDREWSALETEKTRLEAAFADTFQGLSGMRWSDAEGVMS